MIRRKLERETAQRNETIAISRKKILRCRMNLPNIVRKVKEKIQNAPDRIALTILIWLEKEPAHDRVVMPTSPDEGGEPYLHDDGERNGRSDG